MINTSTDIIVTYAAEGFHCWPAAPEPRAYLRARHRHMFCVQIQIEVSHHEREIEFHDLLDFAKQHYNGGELGPQSCETMAANLLTHLIAEYGHARPMSVSIFEDNEVGAVVRHHPHE